MWTTIGHAWAVSHLRVAVESERLSHTYLITGPERVGKAHLALEFAAALGCTGPDRPCGECAHCRRVQSHSHPDLHYVEPDGARLKIEQIRDLQRELSLSPYESAWRVAIVDGFETATVEAANALLKTLEEPPSRVILILIATDADLLLPTIVSRCQVLALRCVPAQEIEAALRQRYPLDVEQAALIARTCEGRPGWAISAVADSSLMEDRRERIDLLHELLSASRGRRIITAESLAKKQDLREMLTVWQSWWRDVILVQAGCEDLLVNGDVAEAVRVMARETGLASSQRALVETQKVMRQLDRNVNARLALEAPLLTWPRVVALAPEPRATE